MTGSDLFLFYARLYKQCFTRFKFKQDFFYTMWPSTAIKRSADFLIMQTIRDSYLALLSNTVYTNWDTRFDLKRMPLMFNIESY